jgi:uncharacterized Ntn-hydrolase superfamily protein
MLPKIVRRQVWRRQRMGSLARLADRIGVGARREAAAAMVDRYALAGRSDKGRIRDGPTAVTGRHCKHAVQALSAAGRCGGERPRRQAISLPVMKRQPP